METRAISALMKAPKIHIPENKMFVRFFLRRRKEIKARQVRTKKPKIGGMA